MQSPVTSFAGSPYVGGTPGAVTGSPSFSFAATARFRASSWASRSFALSQKHGIGTGADSVAVADLDGDGHLELIAARIWQARLSVYIGAGDATAPNPQLELTTPSDGGAPNPGPERVIAADLNGDGRPDLKGRVISDAAYTLVGNTLQESRQASGSLPPISCNSRWPIIA